MWLSPINVTPQRVQALKRSCDEAYNVANAHVHLEKAAGTAQLAYCLAGRLVASKSGWILLEVPAALVRGAFDALQEPGAEYPPAFSAYKSYQPHISVMRPEEVDKIGGVDKVTERGHLFRYTLGPVQCVNPAGWGAMSKCWFIKVKSPELEKLRKSYGLTARPKNNEFDFHITVAVRRKKVLNENEVAKAAEWGVNSEDDPNPYNSLCPVCGSPATHSCRCRLSNMGCKNGHDWHKCPVHGTTNEGTGHGSMGGCTCPGEKESADIPREREGTLHEGEGHKYTNLKGMLPGVKKEVDKFKKMPHEYKDKTPLLFHLLGNAQGASTPPFKMSKEDANYQETPRGAQKCANCRFFYQHKLSGDGICSLVSDTVKPQGWCRLWEGEKAEKKADDVKVKLHYLAPSPIHGKGTFSLSDCPAGGDLGPALLRRPGAKEAAGFASFVRNELGRYVNHQDEPNATVNLDGDHYHIVALGPIKQGEEIVCNYDDVDKIMRDNEGDYMIEGGYIKSADFRTQWAEMSPAAQRAIVGGTAGTVVGAGAGAILSKKHRLRDMLLGGLSGGALGAGGGALSTKVVPPAPSTTPISVWAQNLDNVSPDHFFEAGEELEHKNKLGRQGVVHRMSQAALQGKEVAPGLKVTGRHFIATIPAAVKDEAGRGSPVNVHGPLPESWDIETLKRLAREHAELVGRPLAKEAYEETGTGNIVSGPSLAPDATPRQPRPYFPENKDFPVQENDPISETQQPVVSSAARGHYSPSGHDEPVRRKLAMAAEALEKQAISRWRQPQALKALVGRLGLEMPLHRQLGTFGAPLRAGDVKQVLGLVMRGERPAGDPAVKSLSRLPGAGPATTARAGLQQLGAGQPSLWRRIAEGTGMAAERPYPVFRTQGSPFTGEALSHYRGAGLEEPIMHVSPRLSGAVSYLREPLSTPLGKQRGFIGAFQPPAGLKFYEHGGALAALKGSPVTPVSRHSPLAHEAALPAQLPAQSQFVSQLHGQAVPTTGIPAEKLKRWWQSYSQPLAKQSNDKLPGGLADEKPDTAFLAQELRKGTKHELEHTKDKPLAKEIAKDHLVEHPKYYTKLEKMEKLSAAVALAKKIVVQKKVEPKQTPSLAPPDAPLGTEEQPKAPPVLAEGQIENMKNFKEAAKKKKVKFVAFDLDDTLATYDGWKGEKHFGELREGFLDLLKWVKSEGHKVIVWTCRSDKKAVGEWCKKMGLPVDYVNENPDNTRGSPKIFAHAYVDDRGVDGRMSAAEIKKELMKRLKDD